MSDLPPPPPPGNSGDGYQQQGYGYGYGPPVQKNHGLAVAALVCGLVGILLANLILGPLALIFGLVSLSKISSSNGALKGRGMAITGVVLGPIDFVIGIIAFQSFTGSF
ncbi:MAG: DUF4190 domain-containing protein [Acidimicrobiales bacterium]